MIPELGCAAQTGSGIIRPKRVLRVTLVSFLEQW
jgi:hypothetical protein